MYPLKLLSSNREPMIKLTKPFCYITTETRRLGFKVFWNVPDYATNWIPLWSYLTQYLLPYPEDKEGQWNTGCAGAIQPKNDLGGNFWPPWPTLPLLSLLAAPSCPSSSLIYQDTQSQHARHQHTWHQHARYQHTKLTAGHMWFNCRYWNTNFTAPSTPHPQHIYACYTTHTHQFCTIQINVNVKATIAVPTVWGLCLAYAIGADNLAT